MNAFSQGGVSSNQNRRCYFNRSRDQEHNLIILTSNSNTTASSTMADRLGSPNPVRSRGKFDRYNSDDEEEEDDDDDVDLSSSKRRRRKSGDDDDDDIDDDESLIFDEEECTYASFFCV